MVHASRKDFKLLLSQKKAHFTSFSDQRFIAAVEALLPGCCIVILDHGTACYDIIIVITTLKLIYVMKNSYKMVE
jgi:hypothetical protein